MFKLAAIAMAAVSLSAPAHAACAQADLTGFWRFIFDTGITPTSQTRSLTLSGLLRIRASGAIEPKGCETVNWSEDAGDFFIASSNRPLRMRANKCEAVIGGPIVFSNDFALKFGNASWFFNGASLTISENKQMMLGWLSFSGKPTFAVTAVKRATP